MTKIKIAIAGVGNFAAALVQGVYYYKQNDNGSLGLIYENIGQYTVDDIDIVAAFDVIKGKVGKDLSEAIFEEPNSVIKIVDLQKTGIRVKKGKVLDGLSERMSEKLVIDEAEPDDIIQVLKDSNAEILITMVPSGAPEATRYYADCALKAGCAFINVTPTDIACDPEFVNKFKGAGLPVAGDDLMNQIGSTILHKNILQILTDRGVKVKESYCLDVGGGNESLNALERARSIKRKYKTEAVQSELPFDFPLVAGSTDYVDFLGNTRDSYFWILGTIFGNAPIKIDIRLSTVDTPNGFAILVDIIRSVKLALDRKASGPLESISAYGFKNPPKRADIEISREWFEDFIAERREN
ncbi:MAG: inositol-3-phosphate synthase [Candidatus Lokiarchaeota archaeon]|nr:inositol-3-phosphate synthase [Candidatus Lokiarchaeota archaeon]